MIAAIIMLLMAIPAIAQDTNAVRRVDSLFATDPCILVSRFKFTKTDFRHTITIPFADAKTARTCVESRQSSPPPIWTFQYGAKAIDNGWSFVCKKNRYEVTLSYRYKTFRNMNDSGWVDLQFWRQ
jgi:hypothetical protein